MRPLVRLDKDGAKSVGGWACVLLCGVCVCVHVCLCVAVWPNKCMTETESMKWCGTAWLCQCVTLGVTVGGVCVARSVSAGMFFLHQKNSYLLKIDLHVSRTPQMGHEIEDNGYLCRERSKT